MKYLKHFFSLSLVLTFCLFNFSNDAFAQQNNSNSSWIQDYAQQAVDYFTGDKPVVKHYNYRGQKVSVTIQDLSVAERAALAGASLQRVAFQGNDDLEVADIAFAPDEKTGEFYLSFSVPEEEDTEILVIDVKGNEIYKETVDEFTGTYETPIDVPVTKDATYFLKIVQGFSLTNKKLVVN